MIQINGAYLLIAISDNDPDHVSYLHRETGDVILILRDIFSPGDEEYVDEEALAEDPRYIAIEPISSHDAYRWMEHFAASVEDPSLRRNLLRALDRPRPFRGFKDELLEFPAERRRWYEYEESRQHEAAIEWLQFHGIAAELTTPQPPAR